MKLSELKPCACCDGPLLSPMMGNWYVIRTSIALLHPRHARETMGMSMMLGNALGLAEVMAPAADKAVCILGDEPGSGGMTEVHVCFECWTTKLMSLCGLIERANDAASAVSE